MVTNYNSRPGILRYDLCALSFNSHRKLTSTVLISSSRLRKWRLREVKKLAQSHTVKIKVSVGSQV